MKMKICLIEACQEKDKGSIGAFYVRHHAEKAGFKIDILKKPKAGYDLEMISVHHSLDFLRLKKMPKKAKYRIVGGHPMQCNPLPVIKYADAVFIGEAESHIGKALKIIQEKGTDGLAAERCWIVSRYWKKGDTVPVTQIENPLPNNPPYLNRPNTRSAAWYIEIARGCPFGCNYCELGHSTRFRKYSYDQIITTIDKMHIKQAKKINFYAPDEASHPDINPLLEYLNKKGYMSSFSSMRLESVMRNKPDIKKNVLIRIGIDGLTEETRRRVNKPIRNIQIIEYFKMLLEWGQIQFKMFMMFGYSWEKLEDFHEWENLMSTILRLPLQKNVNLRIKWTPFIPQKCTPLKGDKAKYDYDLVDKINTWHALNANPRSEPGFFVRNDGLMMEKNHILQRQLAVGDEDLLDKIK